ncbi:MAG TPA: type II toxin-antitoxin system VapC family toxin [Casimicrobiaceae bacterium]|nr:type II toxin-antitoxin system VapC family toxin [Casimicrobiaceae bacterium]
MILADTSVWVDHLRVGDKPLTGLLDSGLIFIHPFVIGELALGRLRERNIILGALSELPKATVPTDAEVLAFIGRHSLFGRGIGYIDVHLLAAVRLTAGSTLWTRDDRLRRVADELSLAFTLPKRTPS